MAKHSKKEFAELCGTRTKDLSVYISRGKVIVENDEIDDKNPINAVFIEKQKAKKPKVSKPSAPKSTSSEPVSAEKTFLIKNAEEKAELDLLKRKNEIELQKHEIQKKKGELVPVEAVKSLIILQSESSKTAYLQACDNLLINIAHKKQMTATELSEARREFTKIVNKAIDDAVDSSRKTLKGVVIEYQKKRGVGQHD